jgi:hypothetical protein
MTSRRERLLAVLDQDEPLIMVVRGHLWIEAALELGLSEALRRPGAIDFGRMSFEYRVELAVALGVVPEKMKPGYMKANWLRNQYVHNSEFELGVQEARDLYNAIPPELRPDLEYPIAAESAREATAWCFVVLITFLEAAVTHLRDRKVRDRELGAEVKEVLRGRARAQDSWSGSVGQRIQAVVARERGRRRGEGDL